MPGLQKLTTVQFSKCRRTSRPIGGAVEGHAFSRAAQPSLMIRASAPAGTANIRNPSSEPFSANSASANGNSSTDDLPRLVIGSRLHSAEKCNHVRSIPVDGPYKFPPQHALAVDDVSLRPARSPVHGRNFLLGIAHGHKIDVVQFQEAVVGIAVHVNA